MAAAKTKAKSAPKTGAAMPATQSARAAEIWAQYHAEPSPDLLRVYADALVEDGDPRGPYLQLCLVDNPTEAQTAAKATMMKKLTKKVLAGPGGEHCRELELGSNGLVAYARAEAKVVLEHAGEIARMNPHLVLTVTTVNTLKAAKELGAASELGDVYLVDFVGMFGTGGASLNDKELEALAPALANVRHLYLACRGGKYFTPAALAVLGRHLKRIRYLAFGFDSEPNIPGSAHPAPAAEYAKVIAAEPGFATLRALDLKGITAADVPGRQLVVPDLLGYSGFTPKSLAARQAGVSLADQLEAALA